MEIHWHSLFPSHSSQLGDSGSKRLAHAAGRLEKDKLEAFFAWLEEIQPKTLPKSALGKAVSYVLNHRKGGSVFLRDGNIAASAAVCNFQVSGVK